MEPTLLKEKKSNELTDPSYIRQFENQRPRASLKLF